MKPKATAKKRIDEILDQALGRLGTPPAQVVESARERIRLNLRTANPRETLPAPDATPMKLWGLRQPFLLAGAIGIAVAVLTVTAFRILSHTPSAGVARIAATPAMSTSAPLPASEPDPKAASQPSPSGEASVKPKPGTGARTQGAGKASLRKQVTKPRPQVVKPPDSPAIVDVDPGTPQAPPLELLPTPDGNPGKVVLDRVCTVCHSLRGIEKHNYNSPDAYRNLVSDMISRGAIVTDDEMAAIVQYLYETYGQK